MRDEDGAIGKPVVDLELRLRPYGWLCTALQDCGFAVEPVDHDAADQFLVAVAR